VQKYSRRLVFWCICLLLLFSMNLMAHEQEGTHQFDEPKFSLLESNPNQGVTINTAESNKVTISLPIAKQGQVLLAEYDQNNRFKKIITIPSNARTSVEFTFVDTSLEPGSYVRAFFVGENWEPLAKASEHAMIQKSQENDHVVTGKIMIPETDEAPLQDITISLTATSNNGSSSHYDSVIIQAGMREAQFKMILPEGSYTLRYSLVSQDTSYFTSGYYSANGTVYMSGTASSVIVKNDVDGIDMTLAKKHIVTGKISLPEQNELSTENISVVVYYSSDRKSWNGDTIIIQAGTRETLYQLVLPEGRYTFRYSIYNQNTPYYSEGYYSTIGTVNTSNSASWVAVNSDLNGLDMTLIKGHIVTGKIRIPETDEAPLHDITLFLFSRLDKRSTSSSASLITIQAGSREAQYQLVLAEGSYTFFYTMDSQDAQYAKGYYSTTGTTFFSNSASLVVVNNNVNGIDMTLIKGHSVIGKITIPEEDELPSENICVVVYYSLDRQSWYGESIIINAGTRETQYQVVLPEGNYTFKYSLYNQSTSYADGYYSTSGTAHLTSLATLVSVNDDMSGVDMTLIKGYRVTGKIMIPVGDELPVESIDLYVWHSLEGENRRGNLFTIQAGKREAQYQVVLPAGSYTFGYSLYDQDSPYVQGYYSTVGTANSSSSASLVVVNNDVSGIDMTLIKEQPSGYILTGTIRIPETDATPLQDIVVSLHANSDTSSSGEYCSVTIPAGTREAQYQMVLPVGEYTVGYYIDNKDSHYADGYYSSAGTTHYYHLKTVITVNNDVSGIDMTLIKGHLVTGEIRIPDEEELPAESIRVTMRYSLEGGGGAGYIYTIQAGTREVQYRLILPEGIYTFSCSVYDQGVDYPEGYYSTTGTTSLFRSASPVIVSRDLNDIDMTLIMEQVKRFIVTGTIRIPETDATPLQDITMSLHANSDVNSSSEYCSVTIPAGSREAKYQMVLPEGEYSIRYYTENKDSHYADGYYSSAGTTHYYHLKTLITVNNDVSGIDMTLIKGHLVTGEIRIPDEEELPAESIEVILWYSLEGGGGAGYIYTIQAGARGVQYRLVLPEGIYTFSCSIYNQGVDYPEGYYSTTGTTSLSSSASTVVVNRDLSGIDMTLIMEQVNRYLVTGTIRIPEADDMPQEDIVISLWISTDNKSFSRNSATIIKAGSRETQYQLVLSEGSYGFMYRIENQDTPYIGLMLYSTSGIAYIPPNASLVDVKGDLTGIDMTLSKKLYITGKIIIPEADSAPSMDMNILIVAASSEYIGGVSSITILAGTKEAPFQMFAPKGSYTFEYTIDNNESTYASKGYFSTSGTVNMPETASVILINGDLNDVNICLI